jgi:Protein of unknown function (DUF1552)
MTKKFLNRRLFLRGALATGGVLSLPLPILDGMLNGSGTAYAAGEALPKRYITWFFGNGIMPPLWNPKTTGHDWQISEQLAPLTAVKDYLTVVSGLSNKFPGTAFHPLGSAASTTGGGVEGNSAVVPSIDQLVASNLQADAPLKSLEIGVSDATPNGPENTLHTVSHRGKNAPNFPEFDPQAVFERLFGTVNQNDQDAERKKLAGKSVLDAVLADANELRPKLSASDQQRLDQHMDGIRQLELRLTSLGTCNVPMDPSSRNIGPDEKAEAPKAVSDVMSEMLALALSCRRTHVASVMFTLPAAHVYYRHLGTDMNDDFHDTICHTDGGDNTSQTRVNRGVIYTMQCLSTLLTRMKEITEGDGTLLDSSLVYATSCTSWGKIHDRNEWPVLLAGKAGGQLAGNLHARYPGENLSKVLFSIASLMGVTPTSLGANEGLVTSGLSGLDA